MINTIDNILDNNCILDWSSLLVLESLKKESVFSLELLY